MQGKFKAALKKSGLGEAQVNVIPVAVDRGIKMELGDGETLLEAAERFAEERLGSSDQVISAGFADRVGPMKSVKAALRRWARC